VKILKPAGAAVVVSLIVAQAFRIDKNNPPVQSDVSAPVQVKELMRRSCYGCHSNEVVWPWYAEVAPVSWLVAYDVHQGRAELNFSVWGTYSPVKRQKKLKEIAQTITEGEMPPWYYVYPIHMEARLSAADREAFMAWISSESAALKRQASQRSAR
jgi:Haem-binding domain